MASTGTTRLERSREFRLLHAQSPPPILSPDSLTLYGVSQLAYEYGKQTLPRLGSFESLYYALDLNSADCHEELSESAEPAPPKALDPIPSDAIFVSPSGSDSHSGTLQEPLKSIQNAIDLAATQDSSKTVILRGGASHCLSLSWN